MILALLMLLAAASAVDSARVAGANGVPELRLEASWVDDTGG